MPAFKKTETAVWVYQRNIDEVPSYRMMAHPLGSDPESEKLLASVDHFHLWP